MRIVLASSNPHKVKEVVDILSADNSIITGLDISSESASNSDSKQNIEFILPPDGFDPVEDGETFEENSKIKALAAWELTKTWTLADDSGLCIKALGGKPGIYSARYAETPEKRIERVLCEMEGVEDREAEFVCAMTLVNPEGEVEFAYRGVCRGSITQKASGVNGFGYDPIFLVEERNVTMAQLSESEKNKVSHRSVALREVIKYLTNRFQ